MLETAAEIREWDRNRHAHIVESDGRGCQPPSARFHEALDRYAIDGIETGQFLRACLENDLCGAVCRADPEAFAELPTIMRYIYGAMPGKSWGSKETVEKWLYEKRRLLAGEAAEAMGVPHPEPSMSDMFDSLSRSATAAGMSMEMIDASVRLAQTVRDERNKNEHTV